jgi:hypothetical protein
MSQYIDEIAKIRYYKQRIMQELTRVGIYPNTVAVNERLEDFDAKLALFTHAYIAAGETFDTDQFNEEFQLIREDLKIIYQLVYELAVERYEELRKYANTHMAEFNNMANKYLYKTKLEIDSTALGDTAYFQTSGYDITTEKSTAHIDLGPLEVHSGSRLACIFDADSIEPQNVVFSFDKQNCSPYSLNHDFLTVPGAIKYNKYTYDMPDEETVNAMRIMNLTGFTPSIENRYIIYGGRNQIATDSSYYEKENGVALSFSDAGRITFYVVGGTFINFTFNKKPLSQNFTGTSIEQIDKHQKFTMEYDVGFVIDFATDGVVYATRENGIVRNGMLYYPTSSSVQTFYIEEYLMENKTSYKDVSVTISNLKDNRPLMINTIAIKELTSLEVAGL